MVRSKLRRWIAGGLAGLAAVSATMAQTGGRFNPNADAAADIRAARERAKADNRQVLLLWGDNQARFAHCLDEQLRSDARLKALVESEFELVHVDTGRFEKNIELGEHYQTDFRTLGVPNLTIVDAGTDSVVGVLPGRDAINKPPIAPKCFDQEALFKFLDNGKSPRLDAPTLLGKARTAAKSADKPLLVSFVQPNCPACAAWDRALADPEASAVLKRLFVLCRIDLQRNPGAADVLKRLSGAEPAAKPSLWMTFLNGEGNPLPGLGRMPNFDPSDSGKPLGEWMMGAAGGKMTETDFEQIVMALVAPAPPAEGAPPAPATKK